MNVLAISFYMVWIYFANYFSIWRKTSNFLKSGRYGCQEDDVSIKIAINSPDPYAIGFMKL